MYSNFFFEDQLKILNELLNPYETDNLVYCFYDLDSH